jgi:hypothetical protein
MTNFASFYPIKPKKQIKIKQRTNIFKHTKYNKKTPTQLINQSISPKYIKQSKHIKSKIKITPTTTLHFIRLEIKIILFTTL